MPAAHAAGMIRRAALLVVLTLALVLVGCASPLSTSAAPPTPRTKSTPPRLIDRLPAEHELAAEGWQLAEWRPDRDVEASRPRPFACDGDFGAAFADGRTRAAASASYVRDSVILALYATDGVDKANWDALVANVADCDGVQWPILTGDLPATVTTTAVDPALPGTLAVDVEIDDPLLDSLRRVVFIPGDAGTLLMVSTSAPLADESGLHAFLAVRFLVGGEVSPR